MMLFQINKNKFDKKGFLHIIWMYFGNKSVSTFEKVADNCLEIGPTKNTKLHCTLAGNIMRCLKINSVKLGLTFDDLS